MQVDGPLRPLCHHRQTLRPPPPALNPGQSPPARPEWSEEATITSNYGANKFVLDPNEGFGRNQRPLPLKSKEEREAEDGGTYSDDDGGVQRGGGLAVALTGAAALRPLRPPRPGRAPTAPPRFPRRNTRRDGAGAPRGARGAQAADHPPEGDRAEAARRARRGRAGARMARMGQLVLTPRSWGRVACTHAAGHGMAWRGGRGSMARHARPAPHGIPRAPAGLVPRHQAQPHAALGGQAARASRVLQIPQRQQPARFSCAPQAAEAAVGRRTSVNQYQRLSLYFRLHEGCMRGAAPAGSEGARMADCGLPSWCGARPGSRIELEAPCMHCAFEGLWSPWIVDLRGVVRSWASCSALKRRHRLVGAVFCLEPKRSLVIHACVSGSSRALRLGATTRGLQTRTGPETDLSGRGGLHRPDSAFLRSWPAFSNLTSSHEAARRSAGALPCALRERAWGLERATGNGGW